MHRHRSISGGANAMFTGTHNDRSERCGWAVVLLRAMIMTVETDRRVAMGFTGPPCRWPAHLFRCGALILAALGAACARRHGCDQRLVVAQRPAGPRSAVPSRADLREGTAWRGAAKVNALMGLFIVKTILGKAAASRHHANHRPQGQRACTHGLADRGRSGTTSRCRASFIRSAKIDASL